MGKGKKEVWILDRFVIWVFNRLKPLLKIYHTITPEYQLKSNLLPAKSSCYCGSNKTYSECHQTKNREKGLRALVIKKQNLKTGKVKTKVKLELDTSKTKFKAGSINPLNKNGKFVSTDEYANDS